MNYNEASVSVDSDILYRDLDDVDLYAEHVSDDNTEVESDIKFE